MKIQTLWSTPIILTTIDNEFLMKELEKEMLSKAPFYENMLKEAISKTGVVRVFQTLVNVELEKMKLRGGHCEGMVWDRAGENNDFRLFIGLRRQEGGKSTDAQRSQSGAIVVHDPRAGCAQAMVPGMPFGRPLTVQMERGRVLAFPSWMRWSALPVDEGDEIEMLKGYVRAIGIDRDALM